MNFDTDNPFSVTKATEFTDKQINDYWVDFNIDKKQSIITLLNPKEFLPKYILGSKGCGKTHILRYFSYPLQKIRNNNVSNIIKNDQYVGIYSVLDGLNSSRFNQKGIPEEQWSAIFEYYFELYICNNLLLTLQDIFTEIELQEDISRVVLDEIYNLFINNTAATFDSLKSVNDFILSIRRKVDYEIINSAFTRSLNNIDILFSTGDLLFGIPAIINKYVDALKDVKFIFILDEYEKLFEWQKIYINSLVWEKRTPCTFWIGARKYGYTTRLTKTQEVMKPGSEFQPIEIDNIIRKSPELYKKFAKELYTNRLKNIYDNIDEKSFSEKFEKYSDETLIQALIKKSKGKEFKHLKNLSQKLIEARSRELDYGLKKESDIDDIISNLIDDTKGNPLLQKYKIFSFYQRWYSAKASTSLITISFEVKEEFKKFLNNDISEFKNIEEKYKQDFLAQLTSENNIKNICYSGIDDFINISWGNPRTFILILKKIVDLAKLRGERPLEPHSKISLETQYLAVYDTAKWFYEDAEIIGEKGKNLYTSIDLLTELLKVYRFSDKPTETSLAAFSFTSEDVSDIALEYIKLAELHSLIIEIEKGRKEKNSGRLVNLYQLNKSLAPLWNLPTSRRGTLPLGKELVEAIFNPQYHDTFTKKYKLIKQQLNAPDFCKKSATKKQPPSLFN